MSKAFDSVSFLRPVILLAFAACVCMSSNVKAYEVHGLNFSPYIDADEDPDEAGSQITPEELEQRLALIAPYTTWIRTFGCNQDLEAAGAMAHGMGLQVAVGAWIDSDSTENYNQMACLINQAIAGNVDIAIVGSEVLLRNNPYPTESQLIGYINEVRDTLRAVGVNIPVTYADVYGILLEHPAVLDTVDLIFVNYYPYWEGRDIDYAVAYLHRQHQDLVSAAGEKEIIVSETGWPSCGERKGDAVPSPENANFYFLNFVSWARANDVDYFYFEAYDEGWKTKHEGPQGACWGIWDAEGTMKPGMEQVFNGDTIPDNWTSPIPGAPIIEFDDLPDLIETNIPCFLVAGAADTNCDVWLNDSLVSAEYRDAHGNYSVPVPLNSGDNLIDLTVSSDGDIIVQAQKTVRYDTTYATRDKRLLYVHAVPGEGFPAISGTIVIAVDEGSLLGLIENRHVVGVSPYGIEIYMDDHTVIETNTHQVVDTLNLTYEISHNCFLVSPEGIKLYSRAQGLNLETGELWNLPVNICTGSSWSSASVPGGPAISGSGRYIYYGDPVRKLNTHDNSYESTGIGAGYVSDIALTPDGGKLLVTSYSYSNGRLTVYDLATYTALTTFSLSDFSGEIALSSNGRMAVAGAAGNPAGGGGCVSVFDLETYELLDRAMVPLADNLICSGNDEFFVSSGESDLFQRPGVDMYVLDPAGTLTRVKSFFLGINSWIYTTGRPRNDQIRRLIFKEGSEQSGFIPETGNIFQVDCYPNPFNPITNIVYTVFEMSRVRLGIYDAAGRLVYTIVDEVQQPGRRTVVWDGNNGEGRAAASGIYFVRFECAGTVLTRKLVLLR